MNRIFANFELVPEKNILSGLLKLADKTDLPIISLDRVYSQNNLNLEITRLVDTKNRSLGLSNRPGSPPIEQQLKLIRSSGVKRAVLIDDVIFSGSGIKIAADMLLKVGVRIEKVYAGIGIAKGIDQITDTGIEVLCVRTYEKVIDQVCERDFYPGVPLSGRHLANSGDIGVPYILPFGNPVEWASIPRDNASDLSKLCLDQTVHLFDRIEQLTGKTIFGKDLGRKVIGIDNGMPFVTELQKIADQL